MVLKSLLHLAPIYIYINVNPEHHRSFIALSIKKIFKHYIYICEYV